jgi:hypothetical protein
MSEGTGWRTRHPAVPHRCGTEGGPHAARHSRRMRRLNYESQGHVLGMRRLNGETTRSRLRYGETVPIRSASRTRGNLVPSA